MTALEIQQTQKWDSSATHFVTQYYADVFFYDWNLNSHQSQSKENEVETIEEDHKNTIYIVVIFTLTFALIARDWRKRQWT